MYSIRYPQGENYLSVDEVTPLPCPPPQITDFADTDVVPIKPHLVSEKLDEETEIGNGDYKPHTTGTDDASRIRDTSLRGDVVTITGVNMIPHSNPKETFLYRHSIPPNTTRILVKGVGYTKFERCESPKGTSCLPSTPKMSAAVSHSEIATPNELETSSNATSTPDVDMVGPSRTTVTSDEIESCLSRFVVTGGAENRKDEASLIVESSCGAPAETRIPCTDLKQNRFTCLSHEMFNEETTSSGRRVVSTGTQTDDFLTAFNSRDWKPQLSAVEGETCRSTRSTRPNRCTGFGLASNTSQAFPGSELTHPSGQSYEMTIWSDLPESGEGIPQIIGGVQSMNFEEFCEAPTRDTMVSSTAEVNSNQHRKSWAKKFLCGIQRRSSARRG